MTLNFLSLIEKPVICVLDRRETRFDNGSAALEVFHDDQYEAKQIEPAGDAIRVVLMDREEPQDLILEPVLNNRETFPDICVSCGAPVPEGRMICWKCEHEYDKDEFEPFRPKWNNQKKKNKRR